MRAARPPPGHPGRRAPGRPCSSPGCGRLLRPHARAGGAGRRLPGLLAGRPRARATACGPRPAGTTRRARAPAAAAARAEAIGFFNDYRNLISSCTLAGGCPAEQVDRQFNAGRAAHLGVRAVRPDRLAAAALAGASPCTLAYTFTRTRLASSFVSRRPSAGQRSKRATSCPTFPSTRAPPAPPWRPPASACRSGASYTSRDARAGRAGPHSRWLQHRPRAGVRGRRACVPLAGRPSSTCTCATSTNAHDVASRRPYGARPISPRWLQLGVKSAF